ncbi:MAG: ribonuclease III [Pseudomonadota bacterium]
MKTDLSSLEARLGFHFQDPEMLQIALTHRSAADVHNERLEFLGDAILGFIMADILFHQFPQAREGQLTRLRASLVKRETLASVARDIELGDYLKLGEGEMKSGGWRRDSTLADAVEAILGAVYLDTGESACRQLIQALFADYLSSLSPNTIEKDPKTRLQEYLQAKGQPLPNYQVTKITGEAHEQTFFVECTVSDLLEPAQGEGASRRSAEQMAARKILDLLR